MIEARIVEANVGFDKALSVRCGGNVKLGRRFNTFGGISRDARMNIVDNPNQREREYIYTNPLTGEQEVRTETVQDVTASFMGIPEIPLNIPFVDMGVLGATSGIGIRFISDNAILYLQLSAMAGSGNGEIISHTKLGT